MFERGASPPDLCR